MYQTFKFLIMTTLFYLLTIVFFIYEFSVFTNPKDEMKRMNRMKKDKFFDNQEGQKSFTSEQKSGCQYVFFLMGYLIWSFIGLTFSPQWIVFGLLIVFGMFISITRKTMKNNDQIISLKRFDGFVSMILLLYIYFNHFHPELLDNLGII